MAPTLLRKSDAKLGCWVHQTPCRTHDEHITQQRLEVIEFVDPLIIDPFLWSMVWISPSGELDTVFGGQPSPPMAAKCYHKCQVNAAVSTFPRRGTKELLRVSLCDT